MAVVGYTQNTATLSQNGSYQAGTFLQTGSGNDGTITQVGPGVNTYNDATILQNGTGNQSTINEDNSTFNRGYTTQVGSTNTALIDQSGSNASTSSRGGVRNHSAVGNGNFAGTYQVGTGNDNTIKQIGSASLKNLGEAWQKGTNNKSKITQSGSSNGLAEVFQGIDTRPTVYDEGTTDIAVKGNKATADQSGSSVNTVKIKQFSNDNDASTVQTGSSSSGNTIFIQQGDGTSVTGQKDNLAHVEQVGTSYGNTATIYQTGYNTKNAGVNIYQNNNSQFNIAYVNQLSGEGSNVQVNQSGNSLGNNANVKQYGNSGTYHTTVVTQGFNASLNKAIVEQGSAATSGGVLNHDYVYINQTSGASSSTATVTQNTTKAGSFNRAQIDQEFGSLNKATFSQEGSNNQAGLIQKGAGSNQASVTQKGDGNVLKGPGVTSNYNSIGGGFALQDGSSNKLTLNQDATLSSSGSFSNTTSSSQIGTTNQLTVNQTVLGSATGGNLSTVIQNGSLNVGAINQTAN